MDELKSFAISRFAAAVTDTKSKMVRNWIKTLHHPPKVTYPPPAVQLPHSKAQIKEIIWPQNDCGSSLKKVLKLPQFHFSRGPLYSKKVITLALMHRLHGSHGEGGDRHIKNRRMCCAVGVEWRGREENDSEIPRNGADIIFISAVSFRSISLPNRLAPCRART